MVRSTASLHAGFVCCSIGVARATIPATYRGRSWRTRQSTSPAIRLPVPSQVPGCDGDLPDGVANIAAINATPLCGVPPPIRHWLVGTDSNRIFLLDSVGADDVGCFASAVGALACVFARSNAGPDTGCVFSVGSRLNLASSLIASTKCFRHCVRRLVTH